MSEATATFPLVELEPSMAEACARMTFPVYRHLLSLRPAPRHPEQGDDQLIQPVGFVARSDEGPVGFALAELPLGASASIPELLSLFVRPESRNRGVGTALLERLERHLGERGFQEVKAVYMGNRPGNAALSRVFAKRGWSAPEVRTVTLRFSPRGARDTPWYGRVRLSQEYQIFPWTELTPGEREQLQRSQADSRWIPAGLVPWDHDFHSFDPVSSVGLRYRGQVVGWVINHRVPPATVRFTCSFMRKDLGRRGRILPLYTASLERLEAAGCTDCLFITPMVFPTMVDFVRNRCAPWTGVLTETYGVSKRLASRG